MPKKVVVLFLLLILVRGALNPSICLLNQKKALQIKKKDNNGSLLFAFLWSNSTNLQHLLLKGRSPIV